MDESEAKLKRLKEYYYDDDYALKWIDTIERSIKQCIKATGIEENEAVRMIIEDAEKRINVINIVLQNDEKLTQDDRNKLFSERAVHKFYLDRFDGRRVSNRYKSAQSLLDEEVAKL